MPLEIAKLLWDTIMLRDAARRGLLSWKFWPIAFAAVAVLYGVGVSAAVLYDKHPEYKWLFAVIETLDVVFFVGFVIWSYRWQARRRAVRQGTAR